jgi:hypothetical protein
VSDPADDPGPGPTLVREIDLREPLPDLPGGTVRQAWLMLRVGDMGVGELRVRVPERGLGAAELGAAIAARLGAKRRRGPADPQARSRNRGRMSSL